MVLKYTETGNVLETIRRFQRQFTENCGLGCAPAIFVQFSCFILHSFVPVLDFTYRKALEQLQNI